MVIPHKYTINLESKEKQELRQLKRTGKTERRLADRARIILWTDIGKSATQIAKYLDIHRTTVINWRSRYCEGRKQGLSIIECLQDLPRSGRPNKFTALEVAQIKAVACEKPATLGLPLSRFSSGEVAQFILKSNIVPAISSSTVYRILHKSAIRPWYYHSWIFPQDPLFVDRAGVILDLYQGYWQGQPLGPDEYIISADEKPGIQLLTHLTQWII